MLKQSATLQPALLAHHRLSLRERAHAHTQTHTHFELRLAEAQKLIITQCLTQLKGRRR